MAAATNQFGRAARRETVSLLMQVLVSRMSSAMGRPGADHPLLQPTVFVPVRRGENLTYTDVVARKV